MKLRQKKRRQFAYLRSLPRRWHPSKIAAAKARAKLVWEWFSRSPMSEDTP